MIKWLAVLALSSAAFASAQSHIRCQNTIGGPCGDSSRPREYNCCDYGYCQPWNSAYYQCLDKPSQCPTQETDIDYYGNDIKTIYGLQPAGCCDACATTSGCKVYTFVNQNPDGKTACYLKSAATGRVEKKGAVSGTVAVLTPPANCAVQEVGYDYYGNDLQQGYNVTESACCDMAGKLAGCIGYSYVPATSTCYLKSSAAGRVAKSGVISGKVLTTPTPPANCPTQEVDVDYYGNDIKTLYSVTQTQCCDACGTTSGCTAYTYVEVNSDSRPACYLKSSAAGKVAKAGAISGKLKNVPLPANCPTQDANTDYYGNDIKTIKGVTVAQCCDSCSTTSGCVAYTFVEQNADGKTACYLKSSTAGKVAKTGAVSGALKCPTALNGQCGSSSTGALCCPSGAFCQPWNPSYYQCIAVPDTAKCPTILTGVDFYGGDIETKYGLLPSTCCDACNANANCTVFTFVNYNSDGRSACYLKSKVVEKRTRVDAISGYKAN